jgi:uncharacterized membrane protein
MRRVTRSSVRMYRPLTLCVMGSLSLWLVVTPAASPRSLWMTAVMLSLRFPRVTMSWSSAG